MKKNHSLQNFIEDYIKATKYIDNNIKPKHPKYKPGIGCFGEDKQVEMVMKHLAETNQKYKNYRLRESYPNDRRKTVDLLLPGKWTIEFKWNSLHGDKEGFEDIRTLSKAICYPFLKSNGSSVSLAGDCIKLFSSGFKERKGIVLIYYEKEKMPKNFDIKVMIEQFEFVIPRIMQNQLKIGERCSVKRNGLIHPSHQIVILFGWEVLTNRI